MQKVITGKNSTLKIDWILKKLSSKKVLIVCGNSFESLPIKSNIENISISYVFFTDFSPNPKYEDICKGVNLFCSEGCDTILAVGGGSAMDVAKCIKLFCKMDPSKLYLDQEYKDTRIPLLSVPTTAGSGSESTRFSIIYYNATKYSVTHDSIVPDYVVLDPEALTTLPLYQKKCTMLDALCQGIESAWAVDSTDESKKLALEAVRLIAKYGRDYLCGNTDAAEEILYASHLAGQAINITRTTAVHAMCYKLTTLYGLPHGHAVAVCMEPVWRYMISQTDNCTDSRGPEYLERLFLEIAVAVGASTAEDAVQWYKKLLQDLMIQNPVAKNIEDLEILVSSVNLLRLQNTPVKLCADTLRDLYKEIVCITV